MRAYPIWSVMRWKRPGPSGQLHRGGDGLGGRRSGRHGAAERCAGVDPGHPRWRRRYHDPVPTPGRRVGAELTDDQIDEAVSEIQRAIQRASKLIGEPYSNGPKLGAKRWRVAPVTLSRRYTRHPEGSCWSSSRHPRSVHGERRGAVPPFLKGGQRMDHRGYGMLPRATHTRRSARQARPSGRAHARDPAADRARAARRGRPAGAGRAHDPARLHVIQADAARERRHHRSFVALCDAMAWMREPRC